LLWCFSSAGCWTGEGRQFQRAEELGTLESTTKKGVQPVKMGCLKLSSPSSAYHLLLSVFLLFSALTATAQTNGHLRVWTDKNGKQVTAELRSYSKGLVNIFDGKARLQIKDTALSDADRQYLCGICDPSKGISESELPKRLQQLDSTTPVGTDGKQKDVAEPAENEDGNGNTMMVTAAMQRGETSKKGWQKNPVEATPGTSESEIVFQYATLVSPYTSADYKCAASEREGKNAKPDDFFMKHAPHIVEARFEAKVQNTRTPVVVPLTIKTDENRESDAAKAPGFFALVSSVAR